jgi:hypothetical protein
MTEKAARPALEKLKEIASVPWVLLETLWWMSVAKTYDVRNYILRSRNEKMEREVEELRKKYESLK